MMSFTHQHHILRLHGIHGRRLARPRVQHKRRMRAKAALDTNGEKLHQNPLNYCFAFALPSASFLALYSDVVVRSLPPTIPFAGRLEQILYFSGLLFPFAIIPLLDFVSGRDKREAISNVCNDWRFRWPVYGYVPVHSFLLLCCCLRAPELLHNPLQFAGVAAGVSVCGGLAFTVVHELIHGDTKLEAFLVDVLLCQFGYMHYAASHIAHHIKVGTVDDAGTGRFNESFYAFLPRAVFMSVRDGLWMEEKRIKPAGQNIFSPRSRMWKWICAPILLFSAVEVLLGTPALLFMITHALGGITALELVNYLQHYGLVRHKTDGKIEPVTAKHSWNADWGWTDRLIFNLQRHSHHHSQSNVPYQGLKSLPTAPMLPMSYPGMMIIAFFPPLYFHLMNPRVQQLDA